MAFNVIDDHVFEAEHKRAFLHRDSVPFLTRSVIGERNKNNTSNPEGAKIEL